MSRKRKPPLTAEQVASIRRLRGRHGWTHERISKFMSLSLNRIRPALKGVERGPKR